MVYCASQGDKNRWAFEPSHAISTYIYAVCAGPYAEFTDTYSACAHCPVECLAVPPRPHRVPPCCACADGMPLRWFCRKSLAKYMDPEELFTVTKQGLAFYESFFGVPYPFGKYDQLFAPEFNQVRRAPSLSVVLAQLRVCTCVCSVWGGGRARWRTQAQ